MCFSPRTVVNVYTALLGAGGVGVVRVATPGSWEPERGDGSVGVGGESVPELADVVRTPTPQGAGQQQCARMAVTHRRACRDLGGSRHAWHLHGGGGV